MQDLFQKYQKCLDMKTAVSAAALRLRQEFHSLTKSHGYDLVGVRPVVLLADRDLVAYVEMDVVSRYSGENDKLVLNSSDLDSIRKLIQDNEDLDKSADLDLIQEFLTKAEQL